MEDIMRLAMSSDVVQMAAERERTSPRRNAREIKRRGNRGAPVVLKV
jgi:hypothetical protein